MTEENTTVRSMLTTLAQGARTVADLSPDPRTKLVSGGVATILETLVRMLERRTAEQVQKVLDRILNDGAQPIGEKELDAQVESILADLAAEEQAR